MFENKKIMALICARGGSKGVPGKNIRNLGDKPLIAWSIDLALKCPFIDKVVVSTDSKKIAAIAKEYGALVPFIRPAELAEDHSPEWPVWQHALIEMEKEENYLPDYLVVLPPTSPFRSADDIIRGIEILHKGGADIIISITESGRNPYFNMVELDSNGFAHLSKVNGEGFTRRQDAPKVFDITTVLYAARREFVLGSTGLFDGKVKAITVPELRAIDIDNNIDFKFAEFLIKENAIEHDEKDLRTC